jgi:hypothetical protein
MKFIKHEGTVFVEQRIYKADLEQRAGLCSRELALQAAVMEVEELLLRRIEDRRLVEQCRDNPPSVLRSVLSGFIRRETAEYIEIRLMANFEPFNPNERIVLWDHNTHRTRTVAIKDASAFFDRPARPDPSGVFIGARYPWPLGRQADPSDDGPGMDGPLGGSHSP